MKFWPLVILIFILTSCGYSERESAIVTYESTANGVKTHLGIDILEMTKIKTITGRDSARFYDSLVKEGAKSKVSHAKYLLEDAKLQSRNATGSSKQYYEGLVKDYARRVRLWENKVYDSTELAGAYKKFLHHKSNLNQELGEMYLCWYEFHNPLLNTRQEVERVYIMSMDGTTVYRTAETKTPR